MRMRSRVMQIQVFVMHSDLLSQLRMSWSNRTDQLILPAYTVRSPHRFRALTCFISFICCGLCLGMRPRVRIALDHFTGYLIALWIELLTPLTLMTKSAVKPLLEFKAINPFILNQIGLWHS